MEQTELAKLLNLQLQQATGASRAPAQASASDQSEDSDKSQLLSQAAVGLLPILAGALVQGARGGAVGGQAGMVGLQALEQARKEKEAKAEKMSAAEKEAKKEAIKSALELSKEQLSERKFQEEMGLKKEELALKKKEIEKKAAETKQLPAAQYLAAGYARRVEQSEQVFDKLAEGGYDRASTGSRFGSILPREFVSDARKANDQAERNFLYAVLRRESGAAISQGEFQTAEQQYFPRPGDDPSTIAQKKANRLQVMQALKAEAGKALEQVPLVSVPPTQKSPPVAMPSLPGGATEAKAAPLSERQKRIMELRQKLGK